MYGRGMSPYTRAHFKRVARNMNNYVAASAYNFYPGYDGVPMEVYQPTYYSYPSLGNHFADRLYSVGMPNGIVNLGYYIGGLFDGNM
jgi:hypothetical protein